MDPKLRTAIWDRMVETDRLARYYGRLAGKLALKERVASIVTTTFSVVSAYSVAQGIGGAGREWVWAAIGFSTATVAASVVPLVFRYGGLISSAAYCQVRLDLLSTKCRELWLVRDSIETDQALIRWRALEREQSEITAFQSAKPLDQKLVRATRKENDEYWKNEAKRLSRLAKKRRTAVKAGTGSESLEAGVKPSPA